MLLDQARSQLVMIDMQERLVPAMSGRERLIAGASQLCRAASLLGIPVTATEQNPDRLGPTLPDLAPHGSPAFAKLEFSCAANAAVADRFESLGRDQLVLFGVEAHVCVLQTALAALGRFEVFVVANAVSSRKPMDKAFALRRLTAEGVRVVTSEMVCFEWMRAADHPAFRDVMKLVR